MIKHQKFLFLMLSVFLALMIISNVFFFISLLSSMSMLSALELSGGVKWIILFALFISSLRGIKITFLASFLIVGYYLIQMFQLWDVFAQIYYSFLRGDYQTFTMLLSLLFIPLISFFGLIFWYLAWQDRKLN
tara:strand:- start:422 stop:820 length:399 start_codon:yes stop_codon:yes gene_type:complete